MLQRRPQENLGRVEGRLTRVVPVRLEPELEEALKARAAAEDSNTSEVIRKASAPGCAPPDPGAT